MKHHDFVLYAQHGLEAPRNLQASLLYLSVEHYA